MRRLIGILIIISGLLLLLTNFNIVNIKNIIDYIWPISFIVIGIYSFIINKKFNFFNTGLLILGIVGLLIALGYLDNSVYSLILSPIIIVLIGTVLLNNRHHHIKLYNCNHNNNNNKNTNIDEYNAIFRRRVKKKNKWFTYR